MWVIMMVLASCQEVAEDTGRSETVAAQSGYPSLHTVPPRPQLSYSVEQRRAIVDGLIADRENARYSNQVVRYRTGLSSLPPPDTPPLAAAPLTAAPEVSNAGDASRPPDVVRDRALGAPETEFDHDDDLDSFMEEMAGDRIERPGAIAPGPESNAAPLGHTIVRASVARPVSSPAAADDGPPPAAVWAIPAETAGLPDAPLPTATSGTGTRKAPPPPAPVGAAVAGRAPGVVWGMVDMPDKPAGPAAVASAAHAADTSRPAAAAPIETTGQPLQPTETAIAGRAPGVVWGMVDMPDKPAAPAAAASSAQVADTRAASPVVSSVPRRPAAATPIETSDENGTTDGNATTDGNEATDGNATTDGNEATDGNETSAEPTATVVAERPNHRPPFRPDANAAGIEVGDGLIAVALAPSAERERALGSIAFAPGSATLPPDAALRLERFLAEVKAPGARIRVVGEAAVPALALDRALAVGLALVRRGVPADRLELTLARDAAGDQARLFLAASAP